MLTIQKTALLVVDIQDRLFPHIYMKDELVKNLQMLIRGAQILEIPIIYSEHAPDKIGKTIPEITQRLTDLKPISKITFSCCADSVFMQKLSELSKKSILIAGIETHICVYQTAMDLVNLGHEAQVVSDCVSSRTAHNKVIGLERIKEAGASLTSVETVLCELLKVTQGEKFSEILKLLK